jgi:SulP family sulfate permease
MVPLVALAAVLLLTAKRLIETKEIRQIFLVDRTEGCLVLMTTILTVVIDLTVSVPLGVGFMLITAVRRMVNEKHMDIVDYGNRSVIMVSSSITFLTSATLKHDIVRHLTNNTRLVEIDLTKSPSLDASGAMMLVELLKAHPDVRVIVASSKRSDQLRHAGLQAEKMTIQGNGVVNMPSVYKGIQNRARKEALPNYPST